MLSKVFEKLVNNRIVDNLEKVDFFLISSLVLGLFDQLQISSQLYLIELLGLLTGLELPELWRLIYPKLLAGFGMLVFFTNLSLYGISGQIFGLISFFFAVIDGLEWFWMKRLQKNIQSVLEFLKASFLVLQFLYYTLMIFLKMLFVILLSMLMILLLYFKCDQESDLWQQLELASELESDLRDTVDWGKESLVDFNAGKTQLVLFDQSNNNGSIDVITF